MGSKDAQTYYEEGIRASFEENGLSASSAAYMAQEGIAWGTSHKGFYDTRKLMTADINGADGNSWNKSTNNAGLPTSWMECLPGVWNAAHVH